MHSAWTNVSIRTPGPPGTLNACTTPGDGANVSGSSALMRHSIEWPVERHVALLERQALAGRNPDLLLDDVDAGDELGHRVFDLDARVHFEEEEVPLVVEEELERPGVRVLHRARGIDDRAAELAAHLLGDGHRRPFLEQLLVTPLDRALALAEVHDRAVVIAEDLELDVARVLDVLFEIDVADAERRLGFALGRLERLGELAGGPDDAHAAAAAARHRLDDHREAEILRDLVRLLLAVDRPVAAGKDRDAGLLHRAPRARLVAEQPDHIRRRPDELDVAGLAHFREIRALSEKAVARVDRVGAGDLGGAQHGGHAQVAVGASRRADADVLVGEPDVQRVLVRLRIHGDGLDPQLAAGADDSKRDLPAVGDEYLFEHRLCRPDCE